MCVFLCVIYTVVFEPLLYVCVNDASQVRVSGKPSCVNLLIDFIAKLCASLHLQCNYSPISSYQSPPLITCMYSAFGSQRRGEYRICPICHTHPICLHPSIFFSTFGMWLYLPAVPNNVPNNASDQRCYPLVTDRGVDINILSVATRSERQIRHVRIQYVLSNESVPGTHR